MTMTQLLVMAIEAYAELTGRCKKEIAKECIDFDSVTSRNVLKLIVMSK